MSIPLNMKSKRYYLLIGLLFSFISMVNGQTFTVTEMNFYDKTSPQSIQDYKKDALGATVKLTEYGNDLKVEITDNNNKSETVILGKVDDKVYETRKYNQILRITINSILGYYKSIRMEQWDKDKLERVIIAKRK